MTGIAGLDEEDETRAPFSGDGDAVLAVEDHPLIVSSLISDGEIVLMVIRPSLWMVSLWSIGALGVIAGMVFALAWASSFSWAGWTEQQAFGLGLVLAGIRLVWQFLDWMNRLYVLTDRRVIRRRGIFQVDVFEARLDRIQQDLGPPAGPGASSSASGPSPSPPRAPEPSMRSGRRSTIPSPSTSAVTQAIDRYGRGPGVASERAGESVRRRRPRSTSSPGRR